MAIFDDIKRMGQGLYQQAQKIKPSQVADTALRTVSPAYGALRGVYQNVTKPVAQATFRKAPGIYDQIQQKLTQPLVPGGVPINQAIQRTAPTVAAKFGTAVSGKGVLPKAYSSTAGRYIGNYAQNLVGGIPAVVDRSKNLGQKVGDVTASLGAGYAGMSGLPGLGANLLGTAIGTGFQYGANKLQGKETNLAEAMNQAQRMAYQANLVAGKTNPLIAKGLGKIGLTGKLLPRLGAAGANVAQGLAISKLSNTPITKESIGLDFAMGLVGGPKQFGEDVGLTVKAGKKAKSRLEPAIKFHQDPTTGSYIQILTNKAAKEETLFTGEKVPVFSREEINKFAGPSKVFAISPEEEARMLKQFTQRGAIQLGPEPNKLPQSAELTTKQLGKTETMPGKQAALGSGQESIQTSDTSIDPVSKIIQALKEAKPIRGAQEALYSKARSQQAAKVAAMGKVGGEQGYFAQLGQLKGPLPKAQFEGIRKQIGQKEIDSLFNMVEQKDVFSPFEKVNAKTALSKLLGAEGGTVPTKSELALLSEVFPEEMIKSILDKRSMIQKLFSYGAEAINLPRAMMATGDLSAPLRQGIFLVGRPKQWAPAFKAMFKYAGSESAYKGLTEEIQARPTYKLMRQNKLAITDMGSNLSSREEAFMSSLPEKIPVFGSIAKGSNRAYSGFLNKLRADTFDDMYKTAKAQGLVDDNPKLVEDIANFVNTATGRGNLPKFLNNSKELLNGAMFAPRLVASRVNLLNPGYYIGLDPFVRKEALKSLFSFVGMGTTVLGLAKAGGAEVETNPTSSDFGKVKIGNTRYDPWGGFQQYIKLASQLAAGKIKSSTTGKTMTLGEGYKPMTRLDILQKFVEGKESPVASFITGLLKGQNAMGEPMDIPSEAISKFIPLLVQDLYDLYNEHGPKGLAMGVPGVFGVGSQTYGKTEFVTGKNKLGQETSQIRPVADLPTRISERVFGKRPLGSTSTFNAETYYNQIQKLPKEQKIAEYKKIQTTNPELYKKMLAVIAQRKKGVTVEDEQLKQKGVASGDRALALAKILNKAKTKEERNKLYTEYVRKGVITKDVAKQVIPLLKKY